jgi:hypothetical protein
MRGPVAAATAVLLASGAATAYAAGPLLHATRTLDSSTGATIAVSPASPGARAVVRLSVRHTFFCGRPRPATVSVRFPDAEHVPSSIPAAAVHLSAGRMKAVHVSGKTVAVSVQPPPAKGITCMSIVLGTLKVAFDEAARLGNPSKVGTYAVTVTDGRSHYTGHFAISS